MNELGFELNPYDPCVANKIIDGRQCTIIWHVDDLKVSHVDKAVLDVLIQTFTDRYGKEAPLTVRSGKIAEYLGMTIDYTEGGKVKFSMLEYVERLLEEAADDMKGTAMTPAANHLFKINKTNPKKLNPAKADYFHHMVAKLLYLCKRTRPDIMTAIAFLCTQVNSPDEDDYKKLAQCIKYLRGTKDMTLKLEFDKIIVWNGGSMPHLRSIRT